MKDKLLSTRMFIIAFFVYTNIVGNVGVINALDNVSAASQIIASIFSFVIFITYIVMIHNHKKLRGCGLLIRFANDERKRY